MSQNPYTYPQVTISTPLQPPPQQFTNVATLIDGQFDQVGVLLYLNGLMQTKGQDYTRVGGQVTMTAPPQPTDTLTARVFSRGKQLGGTTEHRHVVPITFRLAGAFDGVDTSYQIVFGPTIFGNCDGINNLFTWGVALQRSQVWRNGVLQTYNVDIATGPTAMVFLPVSLPQPGDILTMLGY